MGCRDRSEIRRLILTCSGGPFYGRSPEELKNVTKDDALKHPNWRMGNKITIDCATLMNKGLEIIEAMRSEELPDKARMDLTAILRDADLVKFAKATPEAEQNEADYLKAYYFVEETKVAETEEETEGQEPVKN